MYGLSDIQLQQLQQVFASTSEVKEARIFGSRARGDYHPYSDIDICLYGDLTTSILARLEQRLDDLLLPYRIDLLVQKRIHNNALLENIRKEGKVL